MLWNRGKTQQLKNYMLELDSFSPVRDVEAP